MEENTETLHNNQLPNSQASEPMNFSIICPEKSSRLLALMTLLLMVPKFVILIPHFIVISILGFASMIVVIIAQFAVLFVGKYPVGMHSFVTGVLRWQVRISAYMYGLIDRYPPFSLD